MLRKCVVSNQGAVSFCSTFWDFVISCQKILGKKQRGNPILKRSSFYKNAGYHCMFYVEQHETFDFAQRTTLTSREQFSLKIRVDVEKRYLLPQMSRQFLFDYRPPSVSKARFSAKLSLLSMCFNFKSSIFFQFLSAGLRL